MNKPHDNVPGTRKRARHLSEKDLEERKRTGFRVRIESVTSDLEPPKLTLDMSPEEKETLIERFENRREDAHELLSKAAESLGLSWKVAEKILKEKAPVMFLEVTETD